jgi:hypothetical protein
MGGRGQKKLPDATQPRSFRRGGCKGHLQKGPEGHLGGAHGGPKGAKGGGYKPLGLKGG